MRFRLYREYGALNSAPLFDAFERGLTRLGHTSVTTNEEVAVIWSVLWSGRMTANKQVYERCLKLNIPIIIIEVGNIHRNVTWRLSIGNINGDGAFGNSQDLDPTRPSKLKIDMLPFNEKRQPEILIAAQHERSLQWQGMKSMAVWSTTMVNEIRKYTDRPIIVRPHPRSKFMLKLPTVTYELPKILKGSYDDFDINYTYHCVINHNSGPAVQAAIRGIPVICDKSSLAGELSGKIAEIENITLPDRTNWFIKLCHTEWTINEISQGEPLMRLLKEIA